jgi:hypothetical protein
VAAFVLAFVPIPRSVPSWAIRLSWLALALAVPVVLGLVIASRRPVEAPAEPRLKRMLRGFPLTLGLALAFLVMFVSVPLMRLAALVRRQKSADIPLVTDVSAYHEVAALVVDALERHGFRMKPAEPGWWVKAPNRILAFFGGAAFAAFVPERIEHYEDRDLALSFYTSGALLRGKGSRMTWAQGLIEETVAHSRGLQTFSPAAQDLERQIRRVWHVYDDAPGPHRSSSILRERIAAIGRDLTRTEVQHDEWQALYRQLLQVDRAVGGERQLLDRVSFEERRTG